MIENKAGQIGAGKNPRLFRVIPANGHTSGPGDKNRGDGMLAGIAVWIGIGVHLLNEFHIQEGFFKCLAHRRLFQRFTVIDKASRDGPPQGRILSFNQDNAALNLNDNINGGYGIFIYLDFLVTIGTIHLVEMVEMVEMSELIELIELIEKLTQQVKPIKQV